MSLIDQTYFVGDLNIPNTDKDYVLQRLTAFIDKKEAELLQDILGYELYKSFSDGTADYDGDASNGSIAQKWLDLIEGAEYTHTNSKTRKWKGLVYETGSTPASLIANYVYFHLLKDNASQTTGIGEVVPKGENSYNTTAGNKMVSAWNEMSEQIWELSFFLDANKTTYTEWEKQDRYCMLGRYRPINIFGI